MRKLLFSVSLGAALTMGALAAMGQAGEDDVAAAMRSEERRVGKEC